MKLSESGLKYFIVMLILLQLAMAVTVWVLNPADVASEQRFALFTAVNLVCFALISYVKRSLAEDGPRVEMLYVGLGFIVFLLGASLYV